MPKVHHVRMRVENINPSRVQYKPYQMALLPENLWVEVPVDVKDVVDEGTDGMVVTLDGLVAMLNTVATSIDAMHQMAILDARKKGYIL